MALKGTIRVPSDKSISHRAVLFGALAEGTSELHDILPSEDVLSSIACVRELGAQVALEEGPHGLCGTITGISEPQSGELHLDCGNSGTSTRLLLGIAAGLNVNARFTGDASLSRRPMNRVLEPLRQMGAEFESAAGCLPVVVKPQVSGLKPIEYASPKASAQVKSCLLLAGLFAEGETTVTEPAASRDHTERLLPAFGVPVKTGHLTASVTGPAHLTAANVTAPADPSSALFLAVAAALIPGSAVNLREVALNPTRIGAFEVMKRMRCQICWSITRFEGREPVGDIRVNYSPALRGTYVTAEEIPSLIDEIPALSLLASQAQGETIFEGAGELRVKESDRFQAIIDGLAAFGLHAHGEGDDLHVQGMRGAEVSERAEIETHHDHRLAMTWHIAGKALGTEVVLDDAACCAVSWPNFYADLESLEN